MSWLLTIIVLVAMFFILMWVIRFFYRGGFVWLISLIVALVLAVIFFNWIAPPIVGAVIHIPTERPTSGQVATNQTPTPGTQPTVESNPTPRPTSTAVTQSTATAAPPKDVCAFSIPNGKTMTVPAGCVIAGDVEINGQALYDSDQTTGLVVVMKQSGSVKAPWGASVSSATADDVSASENATGCGLPNGCNSVTVVSWPN